MIWRVLVLVAVTGAALAMVACPSGGSGNGGGKRAVPTKVEIEWPDAGIVDQVPDAQVPDGD